MANNLAVWCNSSTPALFKTNNNMTKYILIGFGFVAALVVLAALFSIPVWLLWNWLVPEIFGLKTITWLQAWGLMVLCSFLFKPTTTAATSK